MFIMVYPWFIPFKSHDFQCFTGGDPTFSGDPSDMGAKKLLTVTKGNTCIPTTAVWLSARKATCHGIQSQLWIPVISIYHVWMIYL